MHDFSPKAIKVTQIDPQHPARRTRVLLSLDHIVRLVPRYFRESEGKQMITDVHVDDTEVSKRGLKRSFLILDDIGGRFESNTASEKARVMLEHLLIVLHTSCLGSVTDLSLRFASATRHLTSCAARESVRCADSFHI